MRKTTWVVIKTETNHLSQFENPITAYGTHEEASKYIEECKEQDKLFPAIDTEYTCFEVYAD